MLKPDEIKKLFLLREDVTYLNHGSYGACPKEVFAEYQGLQSELEAEPVQFLFREIKQRLKGAREGLAAYLKVNSKDIVPVINATMGVNIVAQSLKLKAGDEILTTDHEYGACDRIWRFSSLKTGAVYKHQPVPVPVQSKEQVVEALWRGVSAKTRVIYLSHITAPTALILPIKEICAKAREQGILTVIDGAHAPGQIELNLSDINPDFYTGNCHKWMCAPKGAAFLYAKREHQQKLQPLIVSWGYEAEEPGESQFLDYFEWTGTKDPSAFLSVPAAIGFLERYNWGDVRARSHMLASEVRRELCLRIGAIALSPDSKDFYSQMVSVQIPECDPVALRRRLWEEQKIEVVTSRWNGKVLLRVSVQGYNSNEDLERLIRALVK